MWRIMACSPNLILPVYDDLYVMHALARRGWIALEKKRIQLLSDFADFFGLVAGVPVHSSHYDPGQALAECQGELFGVRRLRRGIAWRS
jgi:hypothetical protein